MFLRKIEDNLQPNNTLSVLLSVLSLALVLSRYNFLPFEAGQFLAKQKISAGDHDLWASTLLGKRPTQQKFPRKFSPGLHLKAQKSRGFLPRWIASRFQ